MDRMKIVTICLLALAWSASAHALEEARAETRTDQAAEAFGVSGKGVTIAVLDRGISWRHPDFLNEDGTTRIYKMLDMSGQNLCDQANPAAVEYTAADINNALTGGTDLGMRDAVGHGDSTAGVAAGNGRGLPDRRYRGIAPEADLVVVKMTSEGTPAHGNQPAYSSFQGCIDDAIEWAASVMEELDQPGVLIINSGTQWGPMDGTSAVSRKLTEMFPVDRPGRMVVQSSGDEGSLPTHARASFGAAEPTDIGIERAADSTSVMSAWWSGGVPAEITIEFDDGTSVGPVGPGASLDENGVFIINYAPGTEFYPWQSTSGDRSAWIRVSGHPTTGRFRIRALNPGDGMGTVDLYGDVTGPNLTPVTRMTDHLVPGRLNDYSTTPGVIVVGNYNLRTAWTDIDGVARSVTSEGVTGDLWLKSSAGPTRDGRDYGVDVAAAGQGLFAPIGSDTWWATLRGNQPQGGQGLYNRFGGTSASAPLVVGAVALMLEANPGLAVNDVRQILRRTARADGFTGAVPNRDWGWGKLDVHEAVQAAVAYNFSGPWFNPSQSGHGWFVETLEDASGNRRLNVYWYVYRDGAPAWIIATGPLQGSQGTIDAFITESGEFPPDFTGADVMPWGTLSFDFGADGTGTAGWDTNYPGFSSGSMPIVQLGAISGAPEACRSGSWYDPDQSGHGFVVEIIEIAGELNALVAWYVYLDGEQVWLLGQAPIANDQALIPMMAYAGAQFPPDFVPGDVASTPWGTLSLQFTGADSAQASWTTSQPGYSDGAMDLVRLTELAGHGCGD
jgi:hypothetical protein